MTAMTDVAATKGQGESESYLTMEAFLMSVEKKGYRIAQIAVGEHADALDILQDAMCKLVSYYSNKPAEQWKPLFYRILHNRINDWHRHNKLKQMLFFWKSEDSQDVEMPIESKVEPMLSVAKEQLQQDVINVLTTLPVKQQQCFLFRAWEGMSVKETAMAMECSEGSIKTHYFRAVQKLKSALGESHDIKI